MPQYFDNWENDDFSCTKCHWTGKGAALASGEIFRELKELDCPKCGGRITTLAFPTHEEMAANRDKLSEEDRQSLDRREKRAAEFERCRLRSPKQLPDIAEATFVLMWDFTDDGKEVAILIKWGERVIFSEPAFYEDYERFIEVAEIVRQRYGRAVVDLVPTTASTHYLYGDVSSAPNQVAAARVRIFVGK